MYYLLSLLHRPVVPLKKYFIPALRGYDPERLLHYFKDFVEFTVKEVCFAIAVELNLSV
jgi:hypothetical protein